MAGENRKTKEELIEELAESRAEYRVALDAMFDALHVVDKDLRVLLINRQLVQWHRAVGAPADILGKTLPSVLSFLRDEIWDEYRKVFATGEWLKTTEKTRVGDRIVFAEVTKIPILADGKVVRVMTIIHDITEREHIEEALRESEEKFRTLAEESPNIIFIMLGGRVVYTNQRSFEVLGYSREEFYSPDMNVTALVAPEYLEKTAQAFARYLEGQEVEPFEYALMAKNGERIPAIIASRIVDYEGQKALMGVITDISARKASEEALRKSEEKYRTFVENFQGIAYRGALDGAPIFFEGDVERITGYSEAEFLAGEPRWEDIIHPDDRTRATRKFIPDSGDTVLEKEYRIVRKDERVLWVHQSIRPVRDETGTPVFVQGAIFDIMDRKRAEESRERERRAFRIIADSATLDEDASGVCRRVLPELARLLGFEFGTLRLYEPERRVLRLAASVGLSEDVINSRIEDQPIESSNHVAAYVAQTREPIFAPDVSVNRVLNAFRSRLSEMNVRSLVSWPLESVNEDLLGVLHLFHGEPKDIPEADRGFFETIAGMLCIVLARKRAGKALEISEARYRKRFEMSPVPQWEEDISEMRRRLVALRADGVNDFVTYFKEHPGELRACAQLSRVLEANRAVMDVLGASNLEELERLRFENISSASRDPYLGWLNLVAAGNVNDEGEVDVRTAAGETRRVQMRVSAAPGHEESQTRIMVSLIDLGVAGK